MAAARALHSYKQPVSVLVVIYTRQGEVLLLERADFPGYWQSVTGSVEWGEAIPHTARRELREETGIDAAGIDDWQQNHHYDIYPHWQHRYPPGTTQNQEHVFGLCLPQSQPVTLSPREHLSYRWLPWTQAATQVFSPSNRDAILQLPAKLALR